MYVCMFMYACKLFILFNQLSSITTQTTPGPSMNIERILDPLKDTLKDFRGRASTCHKCTALCKDDLGLCRFQCL